MSLTKRLFLSFTFAVGAFAQVSGTVTDTSGAAVGNATVSLYSREGGAAYSAPADGQGRYSVNVPAGEYLVRAQAPGLTLAQSGSITVSGPQTLPLQLGVAGVAASVVVTATGTAQSLNETAKAVDIVERQDLDRRGVENIADGLRETAGLRVSQRGGPGGFMTIQTRGLRVFDTSFLVDGMRFRDVGATQADASSFISDLLIADTARVEVLRGAGSSLYGTNAIGGVVNVVTETGSGRFHGSLTADGGGLGESRGLARLGGEALGNRLHYSAGGGHQDVSRGIDGNGRYRNTTGNGLIDYSFRPGLVLSGRLLATDAFGQLRQSPSASGASFIPDQPDPDYTRTAQFISTLLTLQHQVSAPFSYRISYQALLSNRDVVNGPQGPGFQPFYRNSNQFNGRIDTLQGRANFVAGAHQLISGGYEFEREYFDAPSSDADPNPATHVNSRSQVSEWSHSFDAQDQIRLLHERLQISLSGRVQKFSLAAPIFLGNVPVYANASAVNPPNAYTADGSVAYFMPRSGTKVRAHAGNGYRKPSLYELFGTSFFGSSFSAYGDPRLKPERSIAIDGGVDQYFASDRLRLSATYFYTRLQQVIGFDFSGAINPATDAFGRSLGYLNTGGALARGAELSAEARPMRSTRVQASYTYTNARDKVSQFSDGTLQTPRIAPQSFGLVLLQQFGPRFDAAFDYSATSDFLYPFSRRRIVLPGARQGGFSAGYTQPVGERMKVRLYMRINNLFDQLYYEDGFRTPGRWGTAGLTFSF